LRYLVDHSGQSVTDTMLPTRSGRSQFSDKNSGNCVTESRRILSYDAKNPRIIETVHWRGYRFYGESHQHDGYEDLCAAAILVNKQTLRLSTPRVTELLMIVFDLKLLRLIATRADALTVGALFTDYL
jgi:DNA-binding winged helix-turn-helix (wHTH) protein